MSETIENILKIVYTFVIALIFAQFIYIQFSKDSISSIWDSQVELLSDGVIYENGEPVKLACRNLVYAYDQARPNEKIEISIPLPDKIKDDQCIALLSNQQDLWFYVDDQLIGQYSDLDERYLLEYSSSRVVIIPLSKSAGGKTLRVVYYTILKTSANKLNCPVIGTEKDILFWMIRNNIGQILSAVLLLAIGVAFVFFDLFFKWNHWKDKGIIHLGFFSILVSVWLLCSSNLKTFYFRHISSADIMMYFSLMCCPIPMLQFFDILMKKMYKKTFNVMMLISLANVILNLSLQIAKVANVIDILYTTHVIILLTCIVCLITFLDYSKNKDTELADAKAVMIGLIGFVIAIITEDINIIFFNSSIVGKYLGLGILFLLVMLAYAAIRGMVLQQQDYQRAVHENLEKTTFLATMSHEIRTPINTILGMDEMILRESKDAGIVHYADNIKNAGKTLLSIINDILDFTKIESGKMEFVPVRYNMSHLLNNLISAISMKMDEKGLDLILEIDENIPDTLLGDELRINQAILNVLINAVKYTKQGSITLKVTAKKHSLDETELYFIVTDTGIGIKPEDYDRIYHSFVRLEENRNRSIEGTGLGMAITKQIIDTLGGNITFESEYGKGTTFYIHFKQKILDEEPIGKLEQWFTSTKSTQGTYVEQYRLRVKLLVVDDNEMNLEVIKGLLRRTEAYIDIANSGRECLKMFMQNEYDMVLLDHMMPEMDGVETLVHLKELMNGKREVPVIALTANAIAGAREEYIQMGFSQYMSKPVEYKELIELIREFYPDKVEQREYIKTRQDEYSEYLEKNGIHMKNALKYAGDDLQQYIHLLELFAAERVNEKKANMHEAFRRQKWEDYLVYVHGLKNSARTIGADELADMAYEHEKHSKNHQFVYIIDHYEELIYQWNETVRIIREYLEKQRLQNDNSLVGMGELSEKEWNEYLDRLIEYISHFKKKEATLLIQNITAYQLDEEKRDILQKISSALSEYDYDKAMEIIRENK